MAIYSGENIIRSKSNQPSGRFVQIDGEQWYEIENYDCMQPFFISLASDTDLWMYLASTGGLTAGRQSPEKALFPYYTDDKITEQYEQTGPKTIFRLHRLAGADQVAEDSVTCLWEPFSERQAGVYEIKRSIAKSVVGNKIMFTEENLTLRMRFSYQWAPAGVYGWVRKAVLENTDGVDVQVELLDGLQNVLPAGVERKTQNEFSTLVDGYKKTEVVYCGGCNTKTSVPTKQGNAMALFRMEAILVDRAEPSESLRCNTVYSIGLSGAEFMASSRQLDAFRRGESVHAEDESKGVRGAMFAHAVFALAGKQTKTWYFVADTGKDAVSVRRLLHFAAQDDAAPQIENAIARSTETLQQIVAQNDGVQHTADEYNDARHFANTLFNTMRGGYYLDNYNIDREAFSKHVALFNKNLAAKHRAFLQSLPPVINYQQLLNLVAAQNDNQLVRLTYEYLPITFGRRHGDPSRPWNLFNIRVQDDNGKSIVSYQGNWRDIFQNWEALSVSYPGYVNGIIAKFLNATTVDGYNPYKVTSEGIDWEVIEPENPWSNIGYWGDHQIIYLLKLLELSWQHNPEALRSLLGKRQFAFANVPYRFKSYNEIVADPKNTIWFDDDLHKHINALIPVYGEDARLVLDKTGEVLLTTFEDKLFITLLAKLSNFVPDAGIWMNTLRPEWNDANNALVGYGASMVTLCYMRRYVSFLKQFLKGPLCLNLDTAKLLYDIEVQITSYCSQQEAGQPSSRLKFTDGVGKAAEAYRTKAYKGIATQTAELKEQDYQQILDDILSMIDRSIRANKRADGLYNAYNLIQFKHTDDAQSGGYGLIEVTPLYPMLEGQVAVLTSGALSAEQAADLLDAMRRSDLYRADQRSYMLYPARKRRSFLEQNNIPEEAKQLPAVQHLLAFPSQQIILQDEDGGLHFNGGFNNAGFLHRAIESFNKQQSAKGMNGISNEDSRQLLDLYEDIFNHKAFTGRSGTFYKYEGLGCIYWHMVSKLLLAVGENISSAESAIGLSSSAGPSLERLKDHYREIREGLGSHKQPQEYGSFPFDPYSHTPSMSGVQQPGMTGQVKEDILNRFFELGVQVSDGELHIMPQMLTGSDFVNGELSFTYCHVPFLYRLGEKHGIEVVGAGSVIFSTDGYVLPAEQAAHIFARDGQIKQVIVTM